MAKSSNVMKATFDLLLILQEIFSYLPPMMQNNLALELFRAGSGISGIALNEDEDEEQKEKEKGQIKEKEKSESPPPQPQNKKEKTNLTVFGQIEKMKKAAEIFLKLEKQTAFLGSIEEYAKQILQEKDEKEKEKIKKIEEQKRKEEEEKKNKEEEGKKKQEPKSYKDLMKEKWEQQNQGNKPQTQSSPPPNIEQQQNKFQKLGFQQSMKGGSNIHSINQDSNKSMFDQLNSLFGMQIGNNQFDDNYDPWNKYNQQQYTLDGKIDQNDIESENSIEVAARVIDLHKKLSLMKISAEIVMYNANAELNKIINRKEKGNEDNEEDEEDDNILDEEEQKLVIQEDKIELELRMKEEKDQYENQQELVKEELKDENEERIDEDELNKEREKGKDGEIEEINELIDLIMLNDDDDDEEEEEGQNKDGN
ncbi:MAG: hypothetical protein EZS28_036123, partial [Streblomastix strix]